MVATVMRWYFPALSFAYLYISGEAFQNVVPTKIVDKTKGQHHFRGFEQSSRSTASVGKDLWQLYDSPSSSSSKEKKGKGVYVRPSGAIERGSGFFFPGLEGPRVRIVAGTVLLAVTALNHFMSRTNNAFSEAIALFYTVLVLLQGAIEASKEARMEVIARKDDGAVASSASSKSAQLSQQWASTTSNNDTWQERVQWAATAYISLTPATHVLLLEAPGTVLYRLGSDGSSPSVDEATDASAEAAISTLAKSSGGRVALPSTHPALALVPSEDSRCMILQRTTKDRCLVVASDDLLASFTKEDLQWLGCLARYVEEAD